MPPPRRRKGPTRIAAPKVEQFSELGDALTGIAKAAKTRKKATGIRRASNNPSKVGVDASLRVTRANRMPTAEELLRDTAAPPLGQGQRTEGMQRPEGLNSGLPTAEELLAMTGEGGPADSGVDRTEYLSPPPSTDPGRPRALEAHYNPDNKQLRVVFRNGGTYVYYDVPSATWRALKRNRSFGQTMDRLVINQYEFEKVAF